MLFPLGRLTRHVCYASVFTKDDVNTVSSVEIMEDRKILSDNNITEERIQKAVDKMKHDKDAGEEGLVLIQLTSNVA